MSMRSRMEEGRLFLDRIEGLPEERLAAKRLMQAFNQAEPGDLEKRSKLLDEILGKKSNIWVEGPFYFCYGTHIEIGDGSYINMNCNFIDDGKIIIGEKVLFGPNVTIATVGHPIHPDYRVFMYAQNVVIEDNCWIGAGSTICPNVTIGENSVIGAGSVVTKDIPKNSVAVGNPCKVIREISEERDQYYRPDMLIELEHTEEILRQNNMIE